MSAGLVFVGTLALLNLALTLLVARRIRQLSQLADRPAGYRRPWLATGTQIPAFEAQTLSGERISLEALSGRWSIVGFFSTDCQACREQLPAFAAQAATEGGKGQALAVIVGAGRDAGELAAPLNGHAMVVSSSRRSPVVDAFSIRAYPSIYLLDAKGRVIVGGASVAAVRGSRREMSTDH